MWIPNVFWPTFVASIISAFLVIYILFADIRKTGNLAAFLLFLSLFLWSFGELLERIAGPPPSDYRLAYYGARLLFLGIALLSATFIHFSIDYPYRMKISPYVRKGILWAVYTFSVIGMLLDGLNDFIGNAVIKAMKPYEKPIPFFGQQPWEISTGIVYDIYISWLFLAGLILLITLPLKLRNVKMKIVKMQIWLTFTGMLVAFFLVTVTGFIPLILGIEMYPLTTISFSILGLFIIYTIYRYRLFIVVPASEKVEMHKKMPAPGIYRLSQKDAFKKFADLAKSGYKALGFVSESIDAFKERYGLKATPIFEITENPGKDRLNPQIDEQREMIPFIISTFMEDVENPVILLDLSANHIDNELRKRILDEVSEVADGRGVLIVAV